MSDLFASGIRPVVDEYLLEENKKRRDYGDYWSASSAGYCMRKVIFDRLQVPFVNDDARKQRVFTSGHIFHEWIQGITKEAGISIAQEVEVQDEDLMVRGHFDDLVLVPTGKYDIDGLTTDDIAAPWGSDGHYEHGEVSATPQKNLILYDYKTQNSKNFATYAKKPSYYHKMQLGTYMYMLRNNAQVFANAESKNVLPTHDGTLMPVNLENLTEARILKISKDDLRLAEVQYMWSEELKAEILDYWGTLNNYWKTRTLPPCTCADHENGFLAKEAWNPYFYDDAPCSVAWFSKYPECKAKWEELTNGRND